MKKAILAGVMMAFVAMPAFAQTEGAAVQPVSTAAEVSATSIVAASQAAAAGRQTLTNSSGVRLGRIVRANDDGAVRIIFDGQVVTIPANTLSVEGDRVVTSLSRADVHRLAR